MNKTALLLAFTTAVVFGLPTSASAFDDDPGYGGSRPWYGGTDRTYRIEGTGGDRDRRNEPMYFRPTMRYYGKNYTVSYRYMPVYWFENGYAQQNTSANFRTEAFRIATADIPAWGGKPPRLVQPIRKTPSQTAVTSIVRSRPAPVYSTPAALPVPTAPLPTPNLDPTPIPAAPVAPEIPAVPTTPTP